VAAAEAGEGGDVLPALTAGEKEKRKKKNMKKQVKKGERKK